MLGGFASTASAQPRGYDGGSLLVFPLFDSSPGHDTLITLVNSDRSRADCGNGFEQAEFVAHYTYVDAVTGGTHLENEFLAAGDTLAVLASQHNTFFETGYLYVELRDPDTLQSLDHDVAFGGALLVDLPAGTIGGYTAIAFRGLADETLGPLAPRDACGRALTLGNLDSILDCDGNEYDFFPDRLFASEIFELTLLSTNRLALMTPTDMGPVDVTLLVHNNLGELTPASLAFERSTDVELTSLIDPVFEDLAGDPNELRLRGGRSVQTGWIEIDPGEPALGLLTRRVMTAFIAETTHALHFQGTRIAGFPRT